MLDQFIRFFLEQKLVTFLLIAAVILWGVAVAPFDWDLGGFPRDPVPVDAIPNLGENQQIVFTEWPGRSPQDVEDQVTYPLTVSLLGVPGVHEVRSTSMFGASLIFLIFDEDIEFYWSRARIIEKLNSLPAGLLPADAQPALGPDATALGQVFWYTVEGRDPDGNTTGGWDLHELRSVQDWTVRYALLAAEGISEVASIGGFVREYQVNVNPDALRAHDVTLGQVVEAVRKSNLDIGARVTEINRVEYVVRGLGFIRALSDIEQATVRAGPDRLPIRVKDVATVGLGPAQRRGALTRMGAEAVGGVVVVREGYNPLEAIHNVKARIEEIRPGLPARAVVDWERTDRAALDAFAMQHGFEAFESTDLNQDVWLAWLRANPRMEWPEGVTISQLDIVSFYDRTGLIYETLATLNDALLEEALVVIAVILIMVMNLSSAFVVSSMLPLAILICFILMKLAGVDSNLVSLAGIAIAIGVIADMGIILSENILKHLKEADPDESRLEVVFRGAREVASAVVTAIATTVIGFLPVFTMTGAEGKMFTPLAFTWTFVLFSSVFVALTIVPVLMLLLRARQTVGHHRSGRWRTQIVVSFAAALSVLGVWRGRPAWVAAGAIVLAAILAWHGMQRWAPDGIRAGMARLRERTHRAGRALPSIGSVAAIILVIWLLARIWEPLGPERGLIRNLIFVGGLIGGLMASFFLLMRFYRHILGWTLAHKGLFLTLPVLLLLTGSSVWLGFDQVFGFIPAAIERAGMNPDRVRGSGPWVWTAHKFPGLGRQFMPPLDEGSFLWMPTTMPHASLGEVLEVMQYQDMAMASVPEVEEVIGKLGRAESALDPAPVSMIETIIHYKPEYKLDNAGRRVNFRYDRAAGEFVRDADGKLIPDRRGRPYRQWRDHIRTPDDIWNEIVKAAHMTGTTSAPKLQPIETRLVMLQTGMRAPMGIKLRAPDLDTLDRMAVELERHLRQAPGIRAGTVNAERVVGKPYLEIVIDRDAVSRYGLNIMDVQQTIGAALGGMTVTTTVEGRERYPVRVRYPRELRGDIESIERVLVAAMDGTQIPLGAMAEVRYERGPQMIRGENTFLTAYITFGGAAGMAEVDVVEGAQDYLAAMIEQGELVVPAGVSWRFAGSYEHQLRAMATLRVVLPVALGIIFLILYFQFKTVATTLVVFSGVAVAWAGGFVMLYLYGLDWFLDFAVFDVNMRNLFNLHAIDLSVAVWVGFLALFGLAVDDGVVMATYIGQRFEADKPRTRDEIRACVIKAGQRRIRPCLMTTATTLLALLPVLTSTGRGSELLLPMTLPVVGGMTLAIVTWFTVPVLACAIEEWKARKRSKGMKVDVIAL
jgi:copper/silver efflux system protein